ncbi:MAG: hypothetical protein IPJ75_10870 [Ignavibacteriales bacterium]|nr:hypothetical protein [Ignavibacteriales bacterium]
MKFKHLLLTAVILLSNFISAQEIYFVKFKDNIQAADVKSSLESRISAILQTDAPLSSKQLSVVPFAKGLAERIPSLNRIVVLK